MKCRFIAVWTQKVYAMIRLAAIEFQSKLLCALSR